MQKQVLDLLQSIRRRDDVALLLISHDVSVVAEICDRVLVMYAGRIVEDLPAADLATAAQHPYTRALLAAVPDMDTDLHAAARDRPRPRRRPGAAAGRMRLRGALPARRRRTAAPSIPTSSRTTPAAASRAGTRASRSPLGMPAVRAGDVEDIDDIEEVLV